MPRAIRARPWQTPRRSSAGVPQIAADLARAACAEDHFSMIGAQVLRYSGLGFVLRAVNKAATGRFHPSTGDFRFACERFIAIGGRRGAARSGAAARDFAGCQERAAAAVSRNGDADTMDYRQATLSAALWTTMKAARGRIWVPLPVPILGLFQRRRSSEVSRGSGRASAGSNEGG